MADSTIKSVMRAVAFWRKHSSGDDYELIIHIDDGSRETNDYFAQYRTAQHFRVLENRFGDVGLARNYAAKEAKGEFIFFVDGDDLVSENYIVGSLAILEQEQNDIVVCPEYCIGFSDDGKNGSVLRMANSKSKELDAYMLFSVNLWIMAIAGRRKIFLEHPYIETRDGYGHEDYALNIELAAANIPHRIASGTVYFYRQKRQSRRTMNIAKRHTQPYSGLFDYKLWKKFDHTMESSIQKTSQSSIGRLKKLYENVQNNIFTRMLLAPVAEVAKYTMSNRILRQELPVEVKQEWRKIEKIEPKVARSRKKINAMGAKGVNPYCPASDAYLRICKEFAPGLKIDFAEYAHGLTAEQRDLLYSRLMIQLGTDFDSEKSAYKEVWLAQHGSLAEKLGIVR